jgi:putative nucleotidyltransferase with HDIG domain
MPAFDLGEQLARLQPQPFAARVVLRLLDEPDAPPARLARLVEGDPPLAARVLRLANPERERDAASSVPRAVIRLGSSAEHALVVAAASSLFTDDDGLAPAGLLAHSVYVAAAAQVAAEVVGVPRHESFSAGMLHDLGIAALYRMDRERHELCEARADEVGLLAAERQLFGVTHADAGAEVLARWQFPGAFVEALAAHHAPPSACPPLARTVALGEALAEQLEPRQPRERPASVEAVVDDLGLSPAIRRALVARSREEMTALEGYLASLDPH